MSTDNTLRLLMDFQKACEKLQRGRDRENKKDLDSGSVERPPIVRRNLFFIYYE